MEFKFEHMNFVSRLFGFHIKNEVFNHIKVHKSQRGESTTRVEVNHTQRNSLYKLISLYRMSLNPSRSQNLFGKKLKIMTESVIR